MIVLRKKIEKKLKNVIAHIFKIYKQKVFNKCMEEGKFSNSLKFLNLGSTDLSDRGIYNFIFLKENILIG